ncbi:hypothetical protein scyTo_0014148 [Scyliorhinus torazame]|uniref:tRNA pseudouridine(55) synthase n=1 Tax=Scyliorhinus torazame TaxID=75743 RepID=A0A401NHI6_SCYTO|nr:hypothetical protein [Scyliorhinus torazame]
MAAGSGSIALAEKLQSLNGLFAIHKKKGPTSADVLNILKTKLLKEAGIKQHPKKRKRQALKLGHGGTLDSAASGVLVVGIGKGTKMLSGMLSCSKKYTTVGELGKATDTFDALGMVTEEQSYDVECGGGFYVRSLVNDLGKELSSCAHVKELIRTKQGPFTLDEHALQEEKWTIDEVVKAIESCTELVSSEAACKQLKMNPQENTEQVKEAD